MLLLSIQDDSADDQLAQALSHLPAQQQEVIRLRIALDLDASRQLVVVSGEGLDGEYQFVEADVPALMNLSKFSTDAGYRDALTGSELLKTISSEAELPRPAHLDGSGPLSF